MISPSVYGVLGALESYPVLDTVTKEVVGINAPKIALTRSDTERKDVAISEIGNTMAFGVGGVLVDQLLKRTFAGAQKAGASQTAQRWAVLGRSLGVYSTIFSLMWAIPFIRNYVTAKQTGSVSFADVIKANHHHSGTSHDQKAVLKEALSYYQDQARTILGLGALGTVASAGLARLAAQKEAWPHRLEKLFNAKFMNHNVMNTLLLKEGRFAGFGGMPALLFWGLPAYGGWIHASRDPYERKEQWLKFVNFVACFFGPSVLINKAFQGKFDSRFPQLKASGSGYEAITKVLAAQPEQKAAALKLWAGKNVLSLVSSIALLGTIPQLINWYLTKERMKRDQASQPQVAVQNTGGVAMAPIPTAPAFQQQSLSANWQPSSGLQSAGGQLPPSFLQPTGLHGAAGLNPWQGWNPPAFSDTMKWPANPMSPV